jgi:hypothetical protein
MIGWARPGALPGWTISIVLLLCASAAAAAAALTYSGRTSQHERISFNVSGGYVRKLSYRIIDRCGDGSMIVDTDRVPEPIRIRHSKFGGTFVDPGRARAVIDGRMDGRRATGSVSDVARYRGRTCRGQAKFSLRPR